MTTWIIRSETTDSKHALEIARTSGIRFGSKMRMAIALKKDLS
jgi:hypothetical protein